MVRNLIRIFTCRHNLTTLHYGIFVHCELCGLWRFRRRGEIFFKLTMHYLDLRPREIKEKYNLDGSPK